MRKSLANSAQLYPFTRNLYSTQAPFVNRLYLQNVYYQPSIAIYFQQISIILTSFNHLKRLVTKEGTHQHKYMYKQPWDTPYTATKQRMYIVQRWC